MVRSAKPTFGLREKKVLSQSRYWQTTKPAKSATRRCYRARRSAGRPWGSDQGWMKREPEMPAVTRAELARACSNRTGHSTTICGCVLDDTFAEITNGLVRDGVVLIQYFARFEVRAKAERQARNITSGEPAIVSARNVVLFKVSRNLVAEINSGDVRMRGSARNRQRADV